MLHRGTHSRDADVLLQHPLYRFNKRAENGHCRGIQNIAQDLNIESKSSQSQTFIEKVDQNLLVRVIFHPGLRIFFSNFVVSTRRKLFLIYLHAVKMIVCIA